MEIRNGIDYLSEVKELIIQYTTQLNRDLSFQNLDSELEDLSIKYLPPNGELLVVIGDNNVLGWWHMPNMMIQLVK